MGWGGRVEGGMGNRKGRVEKGVFDRNGWGAGGGSQEAVGATRGHNQEI